MIIFSENSRQDSFSFINLTTGIHCHVGSHIQTAGQTELRISRPAFHTVIGTGKFPYSSACPCAVTANGKAFPCCLGRRIPHGKIRMCRFLSNLQIKENSTANNRYCDRTDMKTDSLFRKIIHNTAGSFQSKSRTA